MSDATETTKSRTPFRALLDRRGFTPATLAARSRVSQATIYSATRGARVTPVVLAALAAALGVGEAYCRRQIAASRSGGAVAQ